jgi:hypothetical protein
VQWESKLCQYKSNEEITELQISSIIRLYILQRNWKECIASDMTGLQNKFKITQASTL